MFYFGVVEDILDPKQLGRARVRVFGLHTHDKTAIPTISLPWASVVQPTTSAANSGIGISPRLLNGTLVILTFADGDDMQLPIIVGTLPSELKSSILKVNGEDAPRDPTNQGFQDPNGIYPKETYVTDMSKFVTDSDNDIPRTQFTSLNPLFIIEEPEDIRDKSLYPYNQVRQSESGHYEEWDDTPGNERINKEHMSGTFEEIRPDGSKVVKIVKNSYRIIADSETVYIEGDVNLHINSNCNTYIKGDWNIRVDGNVNERIIGDVRREVNGLQQEWVDGNWLRESGTHIIDNAPRIDHN